MWVLMRILVREDGSDLEVVRALQDAVTIEAADDISPDSFPAVSATAVERDWRMFFTALDAVIRANGTPTQEDALVYRYRHLGVGGPSPLDLASLDTDTLEGMEAGFAEGMTIVAGCRSQVGEPVSGTGWVTGTAGQCGFNYLRRAVQNFVGTGGNVLAEKKFYAAFTSADGEPLDGSISAYRVRFDRPPPVAGHWSVTVYPVSTGLLYPNELDRFAISATTPGLQIDDDGALRIRVSHRLPNEPTNWLPAPDEPFYMDLSALGTPAPRCATVGGNLVRSSAFRSPRTSLRGHARSTSPDRSTCRREIHQKDLSEAVPIRARTRYDYVMKVKPGTRLRSAVCTTELIVVRAPESDVDITIGGAPASADAVEHDGGDVADGHGGGTAMGKRYVDDEGTIELLCTKAGEGRPAVAGSILDLKDAKPLPSSD
jgi:hypothetical protein